MRVTNCFAHLTVPKALFEACDTPNFNVWHHVLDQNNHQMVETVRRLKLRGRTRNVSLA